MHVLFVPRLLLLDVPSRAPSTSASPSSYLLLAALLFLCLLLVHLLGGSSDAAHGCGALQDGNGSLDRNEIKQLMHGIVIKGFTFR